MIKENELLKTLRIPIVACLVMVAFYKYPDTPYKIGTGENKGYITARVNKYKRADECISDPNMVRITGFVVGCKRYFGK